MQIFEIISLLKEKNIYDLKLIELLLLMYFEKYVKNIRTINGDTYYNYCNSDIIADLVNVTHITTKNSLGRKLKSLEEKGYITRNVYNNKSYFNFTNKYYMIFCT